MQNGWPHTHVWQSKIERDISVVEVLTEEHHLLVPHQGPQLGAPVIKQESAQQVVLKISKDAVQVRWSASGDPDILLKG